MPLQNLACIRSIIGAVPPRVIPPERRNTEINYASLLFMHQWSTVLQLARVATSEEGTTELHIANRQLKNCSCSHVHRSWQDSFFSQECRLRYSSPVPGPGACADVYRGTAGDVRMFCSRLASFTSAGGDMYLHCRRARRLLVCLVPMLLQFLGTMPDETKS